MLVKQKSVRIVVALLACVGMAVGGFLIISSIQKMRSPAPFHSGTTRSELPTHDEIAGEPVLDANAEELSHTIITPHLEELIDGSKNVLYCATFQIAWNELCDTIGEEIHMEKEHPMVPVLNKKSVSRKDLDEADYVAAAGIIGQGIFERIDKELQEKFHGQASPKLLPLLKQNPVPFVFYCYLFKALPFGEKFDQLTAGLRFQHYKVQAFGLENFRYQLNAAQQVRIYDYKSRDDFVVELKTQLRNDRLILAKVQPGETLGETIAAVQKRLMDKRPEEMVIGSSLKVPVLNFDLWREYDELCNRPLLVKDPRYAQPIGFAAQRTRFKLDEKGAILISEGGGGGGGGPPMPKSKPKYLIFDKPFLIMIQRTDAKMPYFALWVANAELLVPFNKLD